MLAAALESGRQPQDRAFVVPPTAFTVVNRGLPSVSVPVLSTISVSTFFHQLQRPRHS